MKLKYFLKSSNIDKEGVKLASITKIDLLDNYDIRGVECKGNQNVKLAIIASTSENIDEDQYFLCENCRKSFF